MSDDPLYRIVKGRLVTLTAETGVPTIHFERQFIVAGGLISYGPNFAKLYKRVGVLTGKILKRTPPAELPVEEPDYFELVINLNTAKALDLTVPRAILARADEVIE